MHAAEFVGRLQQRGFKAQRQGREWRAQCPEHNGEDLNLQIRDGEEAVLVECWSHHCEPAAIARAVGVEPYKLRFDEQRRVNGQGGDQRVFPYRDERGECLYEVHRVEATATKDKEFTMWLPGAEHAGGTKNVRRVLFGLPELLKTQPGEVVCIAEGEKCALAVACLGVACTTNPNGSGTWRQNYTDWLKENLADRRFLVLADNDRAGKEHALAVCDSLKVAGLLVWLAELGELPPAGDVVQWIARGGTAEQLRAMAADKPHPLDLKVLDGEALESEVIPTPDALIPHLLYRGFLTMLAGDSKLGKSSLELRAMLAACTGGWWLDRELRPENRLEESRVLYVNFEDPLFITRDRARRMMSPEKIPKSFLSMPPPYGTTLPDFLDWLFGAYQRLALDAVVIDPIAVAAEWADEDDNAEIARTLKPIARLAAETMLSILLAHHVTKKPGQYGLNIRGASAIKANVLGYLVLERDKELFKLSGINKLSGEWDVTLDRTDRDWSWWIVEARSGSTRTEQEEVRNEVMGDLRALIVEEPLATTDWLAEKLGLNRRTCLRYLMEMKEKGWVTQGELPTGQWGGRPKVGWVAVDLGIG